MVRSIATWALLAAVLVYATPTPLDSLDAELEARNLEIDVRDIEVDPRDFDLSERDNEFDPRDFEIQERGTTFDPRDLGLEDRDVEGRAVRTLAGLATFETVAAASSALAIKQIGVYGGLSWQGIGMTSTEH